MAHDGRFDPPVPSLSSADAAALLVAGAAAGSDADLPRALRERVGGRRAGRLADRLERGDPLGAALVAQRWASASEGALVDDADRSGARSAALARLRERAASLERMLGRLRWAILGPALVAVVPMALRTWLELRVAERIQTEMMGVTGAGFAAVAPLALVWCPLLAIAIVGFLAGSPWWFDVVGRVAWIGPVARRIADWKLNTGRALPAHLGLAPPVYPADTDPVALALVADLAETERHALVLEAEIARGTSQVRAGATLLVTLVACLALMPASGSLGVAQMIGLLEQLG